MAHGEFIMIGAYGAYMTQEIFKSSFPKSMFDAYFPLAILVSFGLAFAIGFLLEVTLNSVSVRQAAGQLACHMGRRVDASTACAVYLRRA